MLSQDLRVRDELDGGEWKFCEGRPQGHDRFGFCQQGLAAAFSPDHHYILFGAPGTYNWKGEGWGGGRDPPDPGLSEGAGAGRCVAGQVHVGARSCLDRRARCVHACAMGVQAVGVSIWVPGCRVRAWSRGERVAVCVL